jgi:hypothetical protein
MSDPLLLSRYASLSSMLVVDGTPVGHLLHMAGAVAGASIVAGALELLRIIRCWLEEQRQRQAAQVRRNSQRAASQAPELRLPLRPVFLIFACVREFGGCLYQQQCFCLQQQAT